MNDTDLELLARYSRNRSEDSFAELVRRHVNLVYSAALRQVRSSQLAEEVTQSVFTDLARNSSRFAPDTILTAWLYHVTRRTAIDVVRREARRQMREQIAVEMNAMNADAANWNQIEPLLDEAVSALDETDRAAVLLRYFENKSLREVGATLGTSDDAAQKRVSRAVERLREFFAKRGITVGASGLAVVISANAVQAAPVGLALTISTAAVLTGTTLATTATVTATKAIAMTTLQKTVITATVAVLAGAGIYEARQSSQLRDQVQTLQQQQVPLTEQIQQLGQALVDATNRMVGLLAENSRLNSNSDRNELLKLRGEVGMLRKQADELVNNQVATAVIARWLDTDSFKSDISGAVIAYANNHNNRLPLGFADIKEYFSQESPTSYVEFDKFEFIVNTAVNRDPPAKGGFNSGKILFRERLPRQKLVNLSGVPEEVKLYGFTDGSVAEVSSGWLKASNYKGFDDWEQQHMVSR